MAANKKRMLTLTGFHAHYEHWLGKILQVMGADDVEIRDFYHGYQPPTYAKATVRTLLGAVPEKYLQGLESIVLTNQSGQPRRYRLGKVTSRKRRVPQNRVLGRYHPAYPGGRPWIELYVDNISRIASKYAWLPLMRQVVFGHVLFHEIGHHIHARIPEYGEKEDTADRWRDKLIWNFFRRKYWYLVPVRKPLASVLKMWVSLNER